MQHKNIHIIKHAICSKNVANEGKQSWFLFTEKLLKFIGIQDKFRFFKFHKALPPGSRPAGASFLIIVYVSKAMVLIIRIYIRNLYFDSACIYHELYRAFYRI
jgi:hypothetical protein